VTPGTNRDYGTGSIDDADVDLTESDLDTGSNFANSTTYYVYACQPIDGSLTPVFKISLNSTYPTGGWTADNSRKIGGFDTDGSGNVSESTLWDLRTQDISGAASSTHASAHARGGSDEIDGDHLDIDLTPSNYSPDTTPAEAANADDLAAHLAGIDNRLGQPLLQVNQLPNSGLGVWSKSTLAQGTTGRQTDFEVGTAIHNDDMEDDDTADYTLNDCTMAFTSDAGNGAGGSNGYYTVTETSASQAVGITLSGLTVGRLYKFSIHVKDGTHTLTSGDYLEATSNDGATSLGTTLLAGSVAWQDFGLIFRATEANNKVRMVIVAGSSETVLIDNWHVSEVTPGVIDTSGTGQDGWNKDSTLKVLRWPDDLPNGAMYGLKMIPGAASDYVTCTPGDVKYFAGRTVTFGCWVKTSTANHVKIRIYDGAVTASEYHTGGGNWEWLTVTATVNSAATSFYISIYLSLSSGDVYISCPMLVFGSYLPEGGYVPIPNEVIHFEKYVSLAEYASVTVSANATIRPLGQSSGKIPANVDAIYVRLSGSCSNAGRYLQLADTTSGLSYGPTLFSQVSNIIATTQGWWNLASGATGGILRDDTFGSVIVDVVAVRLK